MRRTRLLWQLYPSYAAITLISLLAVTWYASRALERFYLHQTNVDLGARAQLVTEQIAAPLGRRDFAAIDALCKTLGERSGTRITVVLPDGKVIGDSHERVDRMENHGDRPEIVTAFAGGRGSSIRHSTTLDTDMMYVAVPVGGAAGDPVVRTSLPVSAIDAALAGIYRRIAVGGAIVALLAALVSLFESRRITRPIVELTDGARRFASGNLSTKLLVPESEEIGTLARAMNDMAAELDARIRAAIDAQRQEDAVLGSMVESVVAVDDEERIIRINPAAAALFDVDPVEAMGRRLQEVVRHPTLHELLKRAFRSTQPVHEEIALHEPAERALRVHGTVLRGPDGTGDGVVLVLHDITRLRRLERVRRDFVANVSHELKTPITTIKGFVETLRGGAMTDAAGAERFLRIIEEHTDRLHAIVEDLLVLSQIEEDETGRSVDVADVEIGDVVERATVACREQARLRSIEIVVHAAAGVRAKINAPLLQHALVNLIDNAVKYSDEGMQVTIDVDAAPSECIIRVTDRGCGIDKAHLSRIFERFYRADEARSRSRGGTGLGLAIVKHVATIHGGQVVVESVPGRGSVFSIVLPLDLPASAA